jgi:hypothetical protein
MAAPWKGWRTRRATAGDLQAPTPGPADGADSAVIYARAVLKHAEITEEYSYAQVISASPRTTQDRRPGGRIEFVMPYDGCTYFTRAARDDVAYQASYGGAPGSAVIGHLLLNDHSRTDLQERLGLDDRYGSIPVEVPLPPIEGAAGELDQLTADQLTGVSTYEFEPDPPVVIPVQLDIELFDPDSLNLPPTDLRVFHLETDAARQRVTDGIAKVAQHVSFRDELILQIVVHLSVPAHAALDEPPRVARLAIEWPTITSLRTLHLRVGESRYRDGRLAGAEDTPPVRYNPGRGCIEWDNVPMYDVESEPEKPDETSGQHEDSERAAEEEDDAETRDNAEAADQKAGPGQDSKPRDSNLEDSKPEENELEEPGDEDEPDGDMLRRYASVPMLLSIRHPGELYKQPVLKAVADVQVPGYLMSGMTARVYDATGYICKQPLTLTTRIHAAVQLTPDDEFAKRDRSPSQRLFFDDILPDEMRIIDIKTALEDRGFEVRKVWPNREGAQHSSADGTASWLQVAHRKVGPDDMVLWVFTEGRQLATERQTVIQGGVTHTTSLPSGELRVLVIGSLPGDGEGRLTHEMNVLHETLRERYGRVRQRR